MMYARIIMMVFFPIFAIAQAPQKINFQSILRNSSGEVVGNRSVSLKITILSGTINGSSDYSETHAKTTDASGLISIQIGMGTLVSGVFNSINWGNLAHFIKLEADFIGGSNYVVLGTQELMSVPYALYASKTDTSVLNLASRLATKLNGTDTVSLSNRINANANSVSSDTSLLNLASRFSTKLNKSDTSDMLFNYKTGLNNKLNWIDTTKMLSKYLRKADTASLSNRIDDKLTKTDTASLSNRIDAKLNRSDFPNGTNKGNILYWNGIIWVNLAPGNEGQVLKMSSASEPVPVWGTDATTSVPAFSPCGTTISDIDGNTYNTVLIGAHCWTKENLRVRRYNNGTAIPFDNTGGSGGNSSTWQNLTRGAHTIYAHDSTATTPSNLTKYGYLYNWYAAKGIYTTGTIVSTDTLNICPSGWHVPSDTEWTTLTTELGGESVAGGKMKSVGTAYWSSQSTGTDNSSGFSVLPGGFRLNGVSFYNIRLNAFFWSATEFDYNYAWFRDLNNINGIVYRESINKSLGASVRCLRD